MEIGDKEYFTPKSEIEEFRRKKKEYKNFPEINWGLRFSTDTESQVRIPYHEYLEKEEVDPDYLNEIKIIIEEDELKQCFKFVAMDIDDDHAIYLLTKIRKCLLKVREHNILEDYDVDTNIQKIEDMLEYVWRKREYFPGYNIVARNLLEIDKHDRLESEKIFSILQRSHPENYRKQILSFFKNPQDADDINDNITDEIFDLKDRLEDFDLSIVDFLTICSLNLRERQFKRILESYDLKEVSTNPYLLYEDYEPDMNFMEDKDTGEAIDGNIDLYKIDIALIPHRQYLKPIREFHKTRPNDKRRLRALVIEYLKSLEFKGDCFDIDKNIIRYIEQYPLFYTDKEKLELQKYITDIEIQQEYMTHFSQKLTIEKKNNHWLFYLKEIHEAERTIEGVIRYLLKCQDNTETYFTNLDFITQSANDLAKKFSDFKKDTFIKERTRLYKNIFKRKLFILTGAPGSGKSYELLRVVEFIKRNNESYLLLTPTGKASLRLTNNTENFDNINAITIHKFLYDNQSGEIENLIVDEMSMVDLLNFNNLLNAVSIRNKKFKRLILVGDEDQLPPIGYGKVFYDLIDFVKQNNSYYNSNYIYLESNCRLETDIRNLEFAKAFSLKSKFPEELFHKARCTCKLSRTLTINYWNSQDDLYSQIEQSLNDLSPQSHININQLLNELFHLDTDARVILDKDKKHTLRLDTFQLLTPYRSNYYGTIGMNNHFQAEYRKNNPFIFNSIFKDGDKIIKTENQYQGKQLILSNGSIGIVNKGYKKTYHFMERESAFTSSIDEETLELAYAITVHKSQGSGFEHVFIILPKKKTLLSRELVYTALTRSKRSMSIFIQEDNDVDNVLNSIRNRSNICSRKTTLLDNDNWVYILEPRHGVEVKSRAEYIIFKALEQKQGCIPNLEFEYEKELKTNRGYNIHPDYTITFNDKIYYWEHLGMLNIQSYYNDWHARKNVFEELGLMDQLITTDELTGITDSAMEGIITDIINDNIIQTPDSSYSEHHYSLKHK